MRRLVYFIVTALLVVGASPLSAQTVAVAPLAENAVTTDGVVGPGEWDDANWYYFDGTDSTSRPGWELNGQALTPEDWSCSFALKHDANWVYVLTVVTDDAILLDGPNQWDDDDMEFYFDTNNSNSDPKEGTENGFQISFIADGSVGGGQGYNDWWDAASQVQATGYVAEFRVNKARCNMVTGGMYGFEFSPDDDDGEGGDDMRDHQIFWNAQEDCWNNEIPWGDILLSPHTKSTPDSRVTNGLQVLYRFEEGSGSTVTDVSGVGTPLNLSVRDPANVGWIADGGLVVNSSTIVESPGGAAKVSDACVASNQLTVEAWVKPLDTALNENGPARVATISQDSGPRNFTLCMNFWNSHAQVGTRQWTERVTVDGATDTYGFGAQTVTPDLKHIAFTCDVSADPDPSGNVVHYINGVPVGTVDRTGDFTGWNNTWVLALANENAYTDVTARDWLGTFHLVAVYDRALSGAEILQNYNAGPHPPAIVGPGAPTDLEATTGSTSVRLDWIAPAGGNVAGYNIYQSETSGGPYDPAGSVPTGRTIYDVKGLTNGTTYFFVVRAFNTSGEGPNSNEAWSTPGTGWSLRARSWILYD